MIRFTRIAWLLLLFASACLPLNPPAPGMLPISSRGTATPWYTPTPAYTQTPAPTPTPVELAFPIRAAYYRSGYPQDWEQIQKNAPDRYHPGQGFYNQDNPDLVRRHIAAMQYGKIQVGILDWWGPERPGDQRLRLLLDTAAEYGFRWALEVRDESLGDPQVDRIRGMLETIRDQYAGHPAYLKLGGRFVVFVAAGASDNCTMVQRWMGANSAGAYLVLTAFEGSEQCALQPDGWQAANTEGSASGSAASEQAIFSFTISPGFWKPDEDQPLLARDLRRWMDSIQEMTASRAPFQIIASFNDWNQGSAVEDDGEWSSASGYGQYLDALHVDGDTEKMFPNHAWLPSVFFEEPQIFIGAGDIASCNELEGPSLTAMLLAAFPDATIFTAGDNSQITGEVNEFWDCFDSTWGRYKERIRPSPGNHDAATNELGTYYDYFGAAAGERGQGYYSYDLGAWHIIALNSNCDIAGGCQKGSSQEEWLRADLAAHPAQCTLAYWHHPYYGSGIYGVNPFMGDIWRDLYDAGVDLVINGHSHHYERFARQDPFGNADPKNGIREFIVGTGGAGFHVIEGEPAPNSERIIESAHGLLKLELHSGAYAWEFIPVGFDRSLDSGWGNCH